MNERRCTLARGGHDDYLGRDECPQCGSVPLSSSAERLLLGMSTEAWVGVASDPATPNEVLRFLLLDEDSGATLYAAGNPSISPETLAEFIPRRGGWDGIFQNLFYGTNARAYVAAAGNPRLSEEDMRFLLMRGGELAVSVASNPSVNDRISMLIMSGGERKAKEALAANPNAPAWVVDQVLDSGDSVLISSVASNPATSPEILSSLLRGRDLLVSLTALENPKTPDDVIVEVVSERIGEPKWTTSLLDHMDNDSRSYPDEAVIPLLGSEHTDPRQLLAIITNRQMSDRVAVLAQERISELSKSKMDTELIQGRKSILSRIRRRFGLSRNQYPPLEHTLIDVLYDLDWWEWDTDSDEFKAFATMHPALEV